MGLMGTAGTLSIRVRAAAHGRDLRQQEDRSGRRRRRVQPPAAGPELDRVLGIAAQTSFRAVAVLPAILLVVFGAIWLYDRSKGGFKPTRI